MKITNLSISNATTVYVLILFLTIGGLVSYNSLPREAAPDVAIPVVIVSTPYFGVSPADIETLVTQPLEKEFTALRDLKKMTSTSAESVSLVTLEFEPEIDIEEALQKIRDKVDKAKPDIPEDAEDSEIIEINASDWPVIIANVSGTMDPVRLKSLAEDIQDDIEKNTGVLRVDLAGGVEREIQVHVDPNLLRHFGVSLNDVIGAIQSENVNLPGGSIDVGPMKYTVRVPGEFENVHEMNDIVVKVKEGIPIYMRDVARIQDGFKEPSTFSRLTSWKEVDGERVSKTRSNVSLSVVKRAGENIIDVADAAREVIQTYEDRIPEGVEIVIVNDMSKQVRDQVHDLENNIISGLLLVLLTLFFFMGGARNAFFVAISVPMSMLITFIVLSLMGVTLNMVVLFSLVLALGMLVDNAIVIVENIYRHATMGKDRVQAAKDGVAEVGMAVVASTATTVFAFFPMLFWPGVTGEFMGYLPLTVIITLLSSLFVALIINPTLCATLLKVKSGDDYEEDAVPDNAIYDIYRKVLSWSLNHRWFVVLLSVGSLIGTFAFFAQLSRGVEFFPETTPERFEIGLDLPDGTRLETTDELMKRILEPVKGRPELVEAIISDTGVQGGGGGMGMSGNASHYGRITVDLFDADEQPSDPRDFMDELRDVYESIPGATIILNKESMGPPAGKPVNIEVAGDDLQVLAELSREIKERIRPIPGIMDLSDDLELTRPEVHVIVDRVRASVAGVDTRLIAQTVRTAINGTEASVFREGDEEYDITVRLEEDSRASVEDIGSLFVVNRDGVQIPIVEVATVETRGGAGSIRHKDQDRVVTISANAAKGFLPAKLLAEVQKSLGEMELPAGYQIRYTGENEDQKEAGEFLGMALMVALFLILLVLVTEFNSILQPMIIIGSVIMSLIGVLWGLILSGDPFGIIMTGIAVISLAGVVVNNSIVLIDYANQLKDRGKSTNEAALIAGLVRFRPVMLTAATTILGLAPLVLGVALDFVNTQVVVGGRSVEMWGPMARAVSSGLLVATVLTLIVVPVLFAIFDDLSEKVSSALGKRMASSAVVILAVCLPVALEAQEVEADAQVEETFRTPEDIDDREDIFDRGEVELDEFEIPSERTLLLPAAREMVRTQNLDVASARTRIAFADAFVKQAYSMLYPTFSANGSYMVNQREVVADFGFPADMLPPGQEAEPLVIQPKTTWNWTVSASVSFNFRALSLIQQAYLQQDLADVSVEAVERSLDLAVLENYFALVTLRGVMEISAEQLESSRTLLKATEARRDAGTVNEFEVTRARLRVVQSEKEVESARLNFLKVREGLANLIQVDSDFDVVSPDIPVEGLERDSIQAQAQQARQELEQARLNVELTDHQIDEIWFKYLPTLSATFQFSDSKDTALNATDPQWALIFSANWVIWDGGFREGELAQKRADYLRADIEERAMRSQVETEIDQAWADFLSQKTQVESARTQVELADEALRQAKLAYQYGATTQLDVINAENQRTIAAIAVVQDEVALQLAAEKLRNLAGDVPR